MVILGRSAGSSAEIEPVLPPLAQDMLWILPATAEERLRSTASPPQRGERLAGRCDLANLGATVVGDIEVAVPIKRHAYRVAEAGSRADPVD